MMWPILDSNKQTLDYTREDIMPALNGDSFVCACINANDPLRDMRMVLDDLKRMGVQSVSNIGPSISYVDHVDGALDAPGTLCLLYTSPSPRDRQKSRMPSSA